MLESESKSESQTKSYKMILHTKPNHISNQESHRKIENLTITITITNYWCTKLYSFPSRVCLPRGGCQGTWSPPWLPRMPGSRAAAGSNASSSHSASEGRPPEGFIVADSPIRRYADSPISNRHLQLINPPVKKIRLVLVVLVLVVLVLVLLVLVLLVLGEFF